jgi:hypothetical protein
MPTVDPVDFTRLAEAVSDWRRRRLGGRRVARVARPIGASSPR